MGEVCPMMFIELRQLCCLPLSFDQHFGSADRKEIRGHPRGLPTSLVEKKHTATPTISLKPQHRPRPQTVQEVLSDHTKYCHTGPSRI